MSDRAVNEDYMEFVREHIELVVHLLASMWKLKKKNDNQYNQEHITLAGKRNPWSPSMASKGGQMTSLTTPSATPL